MAEERVDRRERATEEDALDAGWRRDHAKRADDCVWAWRESAAREPRLRLPLASGLSEQSLVLTVYCYLEDHALEGSVAFGAPGAKGETSDRGS